jgi:hypothetical protein
MKFIAKRDFYRTAELKDIPVDGVCKGADKESPHADHIHEGAFLNIGAVTNESELQTKNEPKKKLIAQLRYAGCIGDASDKDVVARVEQNIAVRKKREDTVAKADKQSDIAMLSDALTALVNKAAGNQAPAAAK